MKDFTIKQYAQLLELIVGRLQSSTVLGWHSRKLNNGLCVRHDVDRKPLNALVMAKYERSVGISSSYYFRTVGSAWEPSIIGAIARLGHEIGYHYEDLTTAGGDRQKAISGFEKNLKSLRDIAEIKTIAMHGSPFSKHNNLDIWKTYSFEDFGIVADAFLSVDYSNAIYLTDTGRNWNSKRTNLRDRPPTSKSLASEISNSSSLIDWLSRNQPEKIFLSVHPERWSDSMQDWTTQLIKDTGINAAKSIIQLMR